MDAWVGVGADCLTGVVLREGNVSFTSRFIFSCIGMDVEGKKFLIPS